MKLPFKFKGIWYSPQFGGFSPHLLARFKPELPKDLLYEALKNGEWGKLAREPHKHANPTWISKAEFEKEYGIVEHIELTIDNIPAEDEHIFNYKFIIWTNSNVVTLEEYDGNEYFNCVPRNPPNT